MWVRAKIPGDRFHPSGMTGSKKLQDLFVDAKVPRPWRERIPLVVSSRGIAWVVGYRVAEWARENLGPGEVIEVRFIQVSRDPN